MDWSVLETSWLRTKVSVEKGVAVKPLLNVECPPMSLEKSVAVKPLLNVQCPPMSLEEVLQTILRWYDRPRVNPKSRYEL